MAKWSRWVQIWLIYPPVLTSCGQDELKFGRSAPQYLHPVVKMSSNLADLPLDLVADLPPDWHLVAKFGRSTLDLPADVPPSTYILWSRWVQIWQMYTPVLISCGQNEFKFGRSTPTSASRCTPQYWHFMVKMSSNLADLSIDLLADVTPVLTSCGQDEFKFGRSTPLSFLDLQKSLLVSFQACWTQWQSGQDEFKFGRSTPRSAGRCTP